MWWLLETIARRCQAIIDTVNYIAKRLDYLIRETIPSPGLRLASGTIIRTQTGELLMSGNQGTTYPLTNAADPSKSTYLLDIIDLQNGTALPTASVTAGNAALVTLWQAPGLNPPLPAGVPVPSGNYWAYAVYPSDNQAETNDIVTTTATLADGTPSVSTTVSISGTPVAPLETESLDPGTAVRAWTGAPAIPASPV